MRIQVNHCHPLTDSFDHALYLEILKALKEGGHTVTGTDLYREGFSPVMSGQERRAYIGNDYAPDSMERYVEILKESDGIVFCFPHWWLSMPAVLKGYFDRIWGPGTAFVYAEDNSIKPNLQHIRFLGVVTSFGSPWWFVNLLAGSPGRRVFKHSIELLCSPKLRTDWLALYGMDKSTEDERAAFLEKVGKRFRELPL